MSDRDLVGRCGLFCGACSIYRAQRDSPDYRRRLGERFKCPPEKVRCEGCGALTPDCWGYDCKIVQCTRENGYGFCYECPKYGEGSCEKFEGLAKGYLTEDNVNLRDNLEKIRSGMVTEWLQESKRRFRCPLCGRPLQAGARKCYRCGGEFPQI